MNNNKAALANYILYEDELIKDALQFSNDYGDFKTLNDYYKTISAGECSGCGKCCFESVQTNFIEFINIINYMKKYPNKLEEILHDVEYYYMHDLFENNSCPMLDDSNRCKIYEVRPLVCRLFGHYCKDDHEKNYIETLETNKMIHKYYLDTHKIDIPNERLLKKVQHCPDYINEAMTPLEVINHIKEGMLMIDSKYFAEGFIDENSYNMGLIEWFVYLFLDEELQDKRIDFTKTKLTEIKK